MNRLSASPIYDALIIGAGLSGLTLAGRLHTAGRSVALLEKSAGVGGRAATRRIEDATFDHGAQFYRVPISSSWEDPWRGLDGIANWFEDGNFTFRAVEGGITRMAKHLSSGHTIFLKQQVVKLIRDSVVTAKTSEGETFAARALYLSCPLVQSLDILRSSNIQFPEELETINYAPALVGLFCVESESLEITDFKYAQDINAQIYSCSNQFSKKVSRSLAFTVTMDQSWSRTHFETPETEILESIQRAFDAFLKNWFPGARWRIRGGQLKKWRFSHPRNSLPERSLKLEGEPSIYLIGDAFGGGGIFGAVESGRAVPI